MSKKIKIQVSTNGTLKFIYDDKLKTLLKQGTSSVKRASHVEPSPDGTSWTSDMRPIQGPILGPFKTRAKALKAEIDWINKNLSKIGV